MTACLGSRAPLRFTPAPARSVTCGRRLGCVQTHGGAWRQGMTLISIRARVAAVLLVALGVHAGAHVDAQFSAHAADIPFARKAPTPPYNWNGPYAGANGGYAGGQS